MSEQSYKIIIRGPRDSLEISPDSPCRLVEGGLSGFDCAGFDVKLRSYAADAGGYAEKRRFAERELSLTFAVDRETSDSVRRQLISMLDPADDLTLDVTLYGERRVIPVIPYDQPEFSRPTFSHPLEVTLTFVAPTVFFREAEPRTVVFRDGAGMLTFPLNLMRGAGTVAGMFRVRGAATVTNPGDGPCGVTVRVRASGGSVECPKISVGTQWIRCPFTLEAGEELVIDTNPRHKTIEVDGVRSFQFDRDSTFFSLPRGDAAVSVSADEGEEFMEAEIEFTPIYFGM